MTITRMALMAWMAGTVALAGEPQQKVTVYLRERAAVHPEVRIPAKALAGRMFAKIGISLEWGKGEPTGESSQPYVCIDLVTGTAESRMPGALAYALPYEGSHITVFFDRIEKMPDPGTVLAHVIVHEITHLLPGISRHSDTGVMKARWTGRDFGGMRVAPLPFTRVDVDLIYAGLSARRPGTGVLVGERLDANHAQRGGGSLRGEIRTAVHGSDRWILEPVRRAPAVTGVHRREQSGRCRLRRFDQPRTLPNQSDHPSGNAQQGQLDRLHVQRREHPRRGPDRGRSIA